MQGGPTTGTGTNRVIAAESTLDFLEVTVRRAADLESRISDQLERYSAPSAPAIQPNCKTGEEQILPVYFSIMRDHISTLDRCIDRLDDLMNRCEL